MCREGHLTSEPEQRSSSESTVQEGRVRVCARVYGVLCSPVPRLTYLEAESAGANASGLCSWLLMCHALHSVPRQEYPQWDFSSKRVSDGEMKYDSASQTINHK